MHIVVLYQELCEPNLWTRAYKLIYVIDQLKVSITAQVLSSTEFKKKSNKKKKSNNIMMSTPEYDVLSEDAISNLLEDRRNAQPLIDVNL